MRSFGERDPLSGKVIELAIEVHRQLGPGLLESAYENASVMNSANLSGIRASGSTASEIQGMRLDYGYQWTLLSSDNSFSNSRLSRGLLPIHDAQLLTYLKLSGIKTGLLINFCTPLLKTDLSELCFNPSSAPACLLSASASLW